MDSLSAIFFARKKALRVDIKTVVTAEYPLVLKAGP